MKEKGVISQIFRKAVQAVLDTNVLTAMYVFNIAAGTALTVGGLPWFGVPAVVAGTYGLLTDKHARKF